jgi:hypothetical protein
VNFLLKLFGFISNRATVGHCPPHACCMDFPPRPPQFAIVGRQRMLEDDKKRKPDAEST